MKIRNIFRNLLIIILSFFLFSGCIKFKKVDARKDPLTGTERAKKNIEEGRGASISNVRKALGSTNYEFGTSNPMWRAALESLDFLPLSTVDYSGGLIISDWYNDDINSSESIKITVRFLSNEISSNSLKIQLHKKVCDKQLNCTSKIFKSSITEELTKAILSKAVLIEKTQKK